VDGGAQAPLSKTLAAAADEMQEVSQSQHFQRRRKALDSKAIQVHEKRTKEFQFNRAA
jgi:hypothetical protein